MSSPREIKKRIRQLDGKALFHLPPLIPSTPMIREVVASEEVFHAVSPPWPKFRDGIRIAEFRGSLDTFSEGVPINVAENPFQKPSYAFMARTDPIELEVWDIRSLDPNPGIRCFGCFGGRDLFIALTWDFRENIDDFDEEVRRCRRVWDRWFNPLLPFTGGTVDEYLTNYHTV